MSPVTPNFITVCLAGLASALTGWVAPPTRGKLQLGECSVLGAGLALGFVLHRDWLSGLSLATLFPSIYFSFSGWQDRTTLPKPACAAAFLGASWFLLTTSHRWEYFWIAVALGLGGPRFAVWVIERTNRTVGLALVLAATIFELTRIPLLLAG
jgi:hypothetical protein